MLKRTNIIIMALVALLIELPVQTVKADSYGFAYLAQGKNGVGRIIQVDVNGKSFVKKEVVLFPPDVSGNVIQVSPLKDWLVVSYAATATATSSGSNNLRLVNMKSGEVRDLAANPLLLNTPLFAKLDSMVWSPDGHSLAFAQIIRMDSAEVTNAFIYSVPNKKLVKISTSQVGVIRFAWSADSSQIAVESVSCTPGHCAIALDLVDSKTGNVKKSEDLSNLSAGLGDQDVCNLQASPDMRFIAFVAACGISIQQEVYVWDSTLNRVTEVTHITKDAARTLNPIDIEASYSLNWLNSNKLLIGVYFLETGIEPRCAEMNAHNCIETIQTLVYDTAHDQTDHLYRGLIKELEINPINGEFAFSGFSSFSLWNQTAIPFLAIGDFNLALIQSKSNLPPGDHLYWSPDGTMLAYRQANTNNFVFVDDANKQNARYIFADSTVSADSASQTAYILPIGWVAAGN
jgi:hypothetical protein